MATKKPAKIAETKTRGAAWTPLPCYLCSGMIGDSKQGLRVRRLDYAGGGKSYSWAHRGCWK